MSLFNRHKEDTPFFPTLLIKKGKREGDTITLNSAKLTKWSSYFTIEFVKGYFILKAGKKNTVQVNGEHVVHKILAHGDIIQTDPVELRYAESEEYSPLTAKLPDRNLPLGLMRGFLVLLTAIVVCGYLITKNPQLYDRLEIALGLAQPSTESKDPELSFLDQKSDPIQYGELSESDRIALARADWLTALRLVEESSLHPQNIHEAQTILKRAEATTRTITPKPEIADKIDQLQKFADSRMQAKLQRLKYNALLLQRAGDAKGFTETLKLIVAIEPDGSDKFHQWAEVMQYQQQ